MKRTVFFLISIILFIDNIIAGEPLKVLAIGNSFSVDALEQEMNPICKVQGKDLLIGNLYIGGCSIERHYNNIVNNTPDYSYRKISPDGTADTIANCNLRRALMDESWDIITFQQASHYSGQYETFAALTALINDVRAIVGSSPRFLWHQTWAYSPTSTHSGFANYGNNQKAMFRAIVATAERALRDNPELKGIIPSGTAIQDARAGSLDDDLTRDGYHLSYSIGRYIAACTWFGVLFDISPETITYAPAAINEHEASVARKAAANAIKEPFEILAAD